MKLGGRNKTCPRYVTERTGLDPLSLVDLGRGGEGVIRKIITK